MPASRGAEDSVFQAAKSGLTRWLGRARDAVMAPWRRFKAPPNPDAIAATVPEWKAQVDRILQALTPAQIEGWAAAHLPGDFDPKDPYIQANIALTYNLLVRIPDEVHAMVVSAILEGTNRGETTEQIAQRVDDILTFTGSENWRNRAKVIAQTETNRHFNGSMLAHGLLRERSGEQGLLKRWDTVMDNKERDEHRLANNQVRLLNQPFRVGGEDLLFPGDPTGAPWNVINCVPGTAQVSAANVSAIFRFPWRGQLLTVLGERGLRATVSPNHPVLTELGWRVACELQKGDHLVGASLNYSPTRSSPNEQDQPTSIGEIFESLVGVAHRQGVNRLAVNFYGDRPSGNVDVVLLDGKLSFGMDPALEEHFSQFCFTCANAPTAPFGALEQFSLAASSATKGVVGFPDLIASLLTRHLLPLEQLGLRLGSKGDSFVYQTLTNSRSTDAHLYGERITRASSNVFLDKVIDVQVNPFGATHLYTLQTVSGIYIADGIVSHNCRCSLRLEKVGR